MNRMLRAGMICKITERLRMYKIIFVRVAYPCFFGMLTRELRKEPDAHLRLVPVFPAFARRKGLPSCARLRVYCPEKCCKLYIGLYI